MVTRSDNTIIIQCDCGCSVLLIKCDFNTIWFDIQKDSFYTAQTKFLDLFRERFKIWKHYFKKDYDYMFDAYLSKEEFNRLVYALESLDNDIKSGKYINDSEIDPSFLKSHIWVEYDYDIKQFILSIRAKYTLKDALTGKVHQYFEPSMNLEDFSKFVNKVANFNKKHGGK